MAKAIKLNLEFDFNFILIGLVSSEPIYRISWLINEKTGIKLVENNIVKLPHLKTKEEQRFSLFSYTNEENEDNYQLIQNKCQNGALIEEQKNIDFFLKIKSSNANPNEILSRIKEIKNINLAIQIQPGSLKSKNRLIPFEDYI